MHDLLDLRASGADLVVCSKKQDNDDIAVPRHSLRDHFSGSTQSDEVPRHFATLSLVYFNR
jgi:hypothetical protein